MIILRRFWRTKCVRCDTNGASERTALPPRTGRRREPGGRARPRREALPLRDSAGITPASLGTHQPGWGPGTAVAYRNQAAATGRMLKAPPSHTWRGPVPILYSRGGPAQHRHAGVRQPVLAGEAGGLLTRRSARGGCEAGAGARNGSGRGGRYAGRRARRGYPRAHVDESDTGARPADCPRERAGRARRRFRASAVPAGGPGPVAFPL